MFFFNDTLPPPKKSSCIYCISRGTLPLNGSQQQFEKGVAVVVERLLRVVNVSHRGSRDVSLSIPANSRYTRLLLEMTEPVAELWEAFLLLVSEAVRGVRRSTSRLGSLLQRQPRRRRPLYVRPLILIMSKRMTHGPPLR